MNPEMNPMDPALERAVSEIRDDTPDSAAIEAAAARVWARVSEAAGAQPAEHIRSCADFQALIPEFRAGRLPEARALLVKDHLHQCVACRRVYEGKVVEFPAYHASQAAPRKQRVMYRWAAAAVVVMAAGVSIWIAVDRYGAGNGRAVVQTVNGALYEISAQGIRPLAAGQDLPEGADIRTAKDSYATVRLADGSTVEMRERSEFSASRSGRDTTIRLDRGNIIVQAAKRSSGHLYVATADCRVAVTGTVFSVNAGVKGSRVSVIQGEVRVAENSQEKVLHPGQQTVTGTSLETAPILYDISWSPDAARLGAPKQPAPGRVSPLLRLAPANTAFIAILPNAAGSLEKALEPLRQQAAQSPQLREFLAGRGAEVQTALAKLHAAAGYFDEVAVVGYPDAGRKDQVLFLASLKRPGLRDYLRKAGFPLAVEERDGVAAFSPERGAGEAVARVLDAPAGGFEGSPCYSRVADAQRQGASTVMCADLARLGQTAQGARYFMAEDRNVHGQDEARATIGFEGPRTGIASWLAPPAPMGSLDYVSPEATFLAAFVVERPAAIVDQTVGLYKRSAEGAQKALAEASQQTGIDVRNDLAASLGGEFAFAVDGPLIPVPSWKLIAEVYDPTRFQATLRKLVDLYNQQAAGNGNKPLRTEQEVVQGRTYYMIGAGDPNPLTEAHYTFADGYLIVAPSRALVTQALQVKTARTSIARSTQFISMMPRDHYANFSAVIYQNFGTTLGPIVGLLGAFAPKGAQESAGAMQALGNLKPTFVAAYGEPDRITIAGSGSLLGRSLSNMTGGSLLGIAGGALPLPQLQGTRGRQPAYPSK